MRHRLPKLASASLWLLAACTSGGGGGGGGGNNVNDSNVTVTSVAQFFQVLETQDCGEAFNCMSSFVPSGSGDTFAGDFGTSVSACVTIEAGFDMPSMFQTEVSAGRMSFSASIATQCVQQTVEPMTCADYWQNGPTVPDACNNVFAGLVADGSACSVTNDCSDACACCLPGPGGGMTCQVGSGSGSGSDGVPSWHPGHVADWFVPHALSSSAGE